MCDLSSHYNLIYISNLFSREQIFKSELRLIEKYIMFSNKVICFQTYICNA